jgi:glyoxylase-like metal-dependent hydrolase (beta-lactamase superfamily II)
MKTLLLASALAGSVVAGAVVAAQKPAVPGALEVVQLQPNFYMIGGAGGNIAVQFGREGAVVVDSGTAEMADAAIAAIKKLTDKPIRWIINTGADPDHVSGNEKFSKAGHALGSGILTMGAAPIIGVEDVVNRMSELVDGKSRYPVAAWPTESFSRKQKALYLNEEPIIVMRQLAAHSDSDTIVFFRRSDVVVTGDVFDPTGFPVIDIEHGGTIQGEIDALNGLIDLVVSSVPLPWNAGGTLVVPGHGRVCEQAEVVDYRDMVTVVRNTIQRFISKGMTLEQIKAANPTQGFRNQYGSDSGSWTTDMFVEAVYKGLTGKKS